MSDDSYEQAQDILYLKKIIIQDLLRTPTINQESLRDFFNIHLKNGESISINLINQVTLKSYFVEIKKRETRNEYRIFLNSFLSELNAYVGDILVFSKIKNQIYSCFCISIKSKEYVKFAKYFPESKNHCIINVYKKNENLL